VHVGDAFEAAGFTPPFSPDNYTQVLRRASYQPYACRAENSDEVRAWQREFRAHLLSLLGIPRIAECAKGSKGSERVMGQVEVEDHIREEWLLETEPGFWVPFYLLKPKGVTEPRPLVLATHGHLKEGRHVYAGLAATEEERKENSAKDRDIAVQAVREGYIAIAPDMRGLGSLRRQPEKDKDANNSCERLQMQAMLFGRTLLGERVWDVMKLVDWAAQRDDVDSSRIAITGGSGGGTVSLFAAACDERISAAVPAAYFCSFEHSIGSIYHCACNYVPGILAAAEMYDVAGLIAPRPFLAVSAKKDPIFPFPAAQESFARLRRIYEAAGVGDRCEFFAADGGHRYYKEPVWPFIRRWFTSCDAV
jgi:dienelactone hydrolase